MSTKRGKNAADPSAFDYAKVSAVMFGNMWHLVEKYSAYTEANAYFTDGIYNQETKFIFTELGPADRGDTVVVALDEIQAFKFED